MTMGGPFRPCQRFIRPGSLVRVPTAGGGARAATAQPGGHPGVDGGAHRATPHHAPAASLSSTRSSQPRSDQRIPLATQPISRFNAPQGPTISELPPPEVGIQRNNPSSASETGWSNQAPEHPPIHTKVLADTPWISQPAAPFEQSLQNTQYQPPTPPREPLGRVPAFQPSTHTLPLRGSKCRYLCYSMITGPQAAVTMPQCQAAPIRGISGHIIEPRATEAEC